MTKIGYVRVSRENQDPSSQIKLMKDMGIRDDDIFIDAGISGWTDPTVRPMYKKLMARLNQEPKPTEIVFSEFSRIGRNAMDGLAELTRLERMGLVLRSLSEHESFINDVQRPWQGFILHGMMVGAEIERKHHRERTTWALNMVKERGSKSGKPIGRPKVKIDMELVKKTMEQYNVREKVAIRILGIKESTFYKRKNKFAKTNFTSA